MKKLILLLLPLLAACGRNNESAPFKVGVMAGPEEQLAQTAARVAKEKFALQVEIVTFSGYVTPNDALDHGSIDVNAFQHKPYLDQQIKDRGYHLAIVGKTFVYPIAAYSRRYKNVKDIPDAAQFAIPNDPTNLGRALALLAKQGFIRLRDGVGVNGSVLDIVDNPRRFKIVELESAQLPRSLDDVDLAIINTNYATPIGLNAVRDGLFVEDKDSPYVNLIVSRENNQTDPHVLNFVKSYQSPEVAEVAKQLFAGGAVQGW